MWHTKVIVCTRENLCLGQYVTLRVQFDYTEYPLLPHTSLPLPHTHAHHTHTHTQHTHIHTDTHTNIYIYSITRHIPHTFFCITKHSYMGHIIVCTFHGVVPGGAVSAAWALSPRLPHNHGSGPAWGWRVQLQHGSSLHSHPYHIGGKREEKKKKKKFRV